MTNPPPRRMTLRQLFTHSEKYTRDLMERVQSSLMASLADFRDLSRPVRRRSHYPTFLALANAMHQLQQLGKECHGMADYLHERLQEIREQARRERANRR